MHKIYFKGKLNEEDAFEATEIWKQEFTTKITNDEKVIFVCNCL